MATADDETRLQPFDGRLCSPPIEGRRLSEITSTAATVATIPPPTSHHMARLAGRTGP